MSQKKREQKHQNKQNSASLGILQKYEQKKLSMEAQKSSNVESGSKRAKSYQDPEKESFLKEKPAREVNENSVSFEEGSKNSQQEQIFDTTADFVSFDQIGSGKLKDLNQKQLSLEDEMSKKFNRDEHYPWISDETLQIKDMHAFLHNEILDYVKWLEPSPEDKLTRVNLVKKIKKVTKESYQEAVVMVFGSCATGLNLPNSDIDLLVYHPQVKELTMLNKLSNSLIRAQLCKSIEPLKFTKVPLIKLQDKDSNINVDISFNRTNGIYCVKLVKFLQKKYPELRPLILVLKAFLKSRQLNETYHGGVGSFLLTMLVTSYLQRQYKLGGTDKIDLGQHLIKFFELYGQLFNYDQVGISIRKQGSYFSKERRGWEGNGDANRARLCVENPQDPEVDIGRPAYNIKKVQRAFQHAYDTLIYNNNNSVSLLNLIITSNPKDLE